MTHSRTAHHIKTLIRYPEPKPEPKPKPTPEPKPDPKPKLEATPRALA